MKGTQSPTNDKANNGRGVGQFGEGRRGGGHRADVSYLKNMDLFLGFGKYKNKTKHWPDEQILIKETGRQIKEDK
ncbi:unnamed protein product [Coffea canephora]|uniref:Uncharacterized protein n=1 Tax=Coffea canephora TaxID=49390 RepID=A0A068UZD5_COFCA|nr:unnamed protein product [Coffea canephora]